MLYGTMNIGIGIGLNIGISTQGLSTNLPISDIQVIQNASDADYVMIHNSDKDVTNLDYGDTADHTNHTKVMTYKDIDVNGVSQKAIDTFVDVFDYLMETWTYTRTFLHEDNTNDIQFVIRNLTKVP